MAFSCKFISMRMKLGTIPNFSFRWFWCPVSTTTNGELEILVARGLIKQFEFAKDIRLVPVKLNS